MGIILWIIFSVAIFILYHKVFDVVYLDLSQGLMRELIFVAIGGAFLTGLTVALWWLADIIIVIAAISLRGKCKTAGARNMLTIGAIVLAGWIAVSGIFLA